MGPRRFSRRGRIAAGTAVLALVAAPAAGSPESGPRESFDRFSEAFLAADVETLAALLTDDYIHTNSGAPPLGRTEWLAWVGGRTARVAAGELVYDDYRVEDLAIRRHGDAAVITGRARGRGRDGDRAFTVDVRFTQLWVDTDDGWRRAAFHDAAAKE